MKLLLSGILICTAAIALVQVAPIVDRWQKDRALQAWATAWLVAFRLLRRRP